MSKCNINIREITKDIFKIWLVGKTDFLYNFIFWVNHALGKHNTYTEIETDKTAFRGDWLYIYESLAHYLIYKIFFLFPQESEDTILQTGMYVLPYQQSNLAKNQWQQHSIFLLTFQETLVHSYQIIYFGWHLKLN